MRKIIKVDVKVASDDEFMTCYSSEREKIIKFIKKTEKGFENVEDIRHKTVNGPAPNSLDFSQVALSV